MEKPNGKLIFYGDEVPITFPPLYNNFIPLLQEILGLDDDFLSSIKLSYRDRDEDKIQINSSEEYKLFMDEIQKGKEMVMTIEVKEESKLDIKSCSSSILNYVEKRSGNINNLSEQVKQNSIDKVKEDSNINNDKDLDLNENINNDINQPKNDDNDNINLGNPLQNNKKVQVPIKSKKDQNLFPVSNNQNNINNNINNINNFNNNINNINNINNNINNMDQPFLNQNQNVPQLSQKQNQNQNPQKIDSSKLTNKFLFMIAFPYACSFCKAGPIYRVMYYCKECNFVICPRCEQREGERHFHPLYKVQNGSQFKYLDINGPSTIDMIKDKMEGAYNSVLGFFGAGNNNPNISKAQPQQVPQLVSVVQLARNIYDLRNVSDQQIEDALIKARGNIDEAVFSLVPK